MKETIQCNESEGKLTIEILPSMKTIVRLGLVFKGIFIIGCSIFTTIIILTTISDITIASLMLIAMCIIYFIAGKKYLNRVFYKEIVEVDKNDVPVEQTVIKLEFDTKSLEGKLVFIEEEESKEASFKLKAHEKKEAKNLPKNAVIFSHCGEVEVELE